jgi:adenylate cyclase
MNTEGFKRKLTAILSADVKDYSRLMSQDEVGTIETLKTYRELISSFVQQYKGRIIDTPGDNILAAFESVSNAVNCAAEIQRELAERNAQIPSMRMMQWRIGVNLGDVIEDDDRIYGDGVNIAARIEALAEPGGICVSGTVYDHVKNKLGLEYEYLGEQEVKNIQEPVRVYKVLSYPGAAAHRVVKAKTAVEKKWRKTIFATAIVILLLCIVFVVIRNYYYRIEIMPVAGDVEEAPKTIAVLPFDNLSPDPDQAYFADGIAEELLNSLTRISELEVRGRTSSFSFKDEKKDLPSISKKLNVEYIMEGSVRKAGEQVRITVQLINTRKDAHIWSETYKRTMDDIFAIQENIAKSVADALQITLGVGELGREPGMTTNIAAYDAYLAGRSLWLQPGRENISRAIEQLEHAVALDPDFAIGWNALAKAYNSGVIIPERAEEFVAKERAALSRVVELTPDTNLALRIAASRSGDMAEVERLYKKALSLAPANYETNGEYGWFLNRVGRPTEAIDYFQRGVRLEPLVSSSHEWLGSTYEMSGNCDAAVNAMKKARDLSDQPVVFIGGLLVMALEENNRALIDEYLALVLNTELHGSISDTRYFMQVMHALLDTPEKAGAELRLFLTDPAYNNPMLLSAIAVWASYFGEHELALQAYRESTGLHVYFWRPIHKGMRQLPGFKDLVRDLGLVDYWRASGNWGDFCHPVGDDDFVCD